MDPVDVIEGDVTFLDRADVDTDQIIPKQFLKRVERTGFGEFLFYDWLRDGEIELAANPILVSGPNFGSGSSREHAVWALADYGFRASIAPSFGDIFFNNALKNGMLPIVQPVAVVASLLEQLAAKPGATITIDLERQEITAPDGSKHAFDVDPFSKHCLLNGIDELEYTLSQADQITAFERGL